MCDGSVQFVSEMMDPAVLEQIAGPKQDSVFNDTTDSVFRF